jgi:riboflavin synthase
MFTGIVTDVGEVVAVKPREAGASFRIATTYDPDTIAIGASIACGGPCLTVVERGSAGNRAFFDVEASSETLARTTMNEWRRTRVIFERSLKLGDELGGHLVSGHVDGVARIVERRDEADMARFTFEAPAGLERFIAEKGSVALDGRLLPSTPSMGETST